MHAIAWWMIVKNYLFHRCRKMCFHRRKNISTSVVQILSIGVIPLNYSLKHVRKIGLHTKKGRKNIIRWIWQLQILYHFMAVNKLCVVDIYLGCFNSPFFNLVFLLNIWKLKVTWLRKVVHRKKKNVKS